MTELTWINSIVYPRKLIVGIIALLIVLSANALAAYEPPYAEGQNSSKQHENSINPNDTIEQLMLRSEQCLSTDKKKSEALIREAFGIILKKQPIDSTMLADAYHVLGKVLINKKDYRPGIDTLKECLSIKQNALVHDHKSLAKTLNYIGIGFFRLMEFDSAIYFYNRSKQLLIDNNIQDINLYYAYLNIGISFSELGKYNTAIDYFDTALMALNESGQIADSLVIAYYYYNYALFTTLTGKLKEANGYYGKAEAIYSKKLGSFHVILAGINNNKGINSYYGYDFSKAELYYKKALDIYVANDANIEGIPRMYSNLSQVSQNTGDFSSSINYCLSGLGHSPGNDLSLILHKNIACSYAAIGNMEKADHYFKIALDLLSKENINPKRQGELYSSYADFLLATENGSLCLVFYKKALGSANSLYGNDSDQFALILSQIGAYYLYDQNNADSAIRYFGRSISIFDKNNADTEGANINIVMEGNARIGHASALLLKYGQTREIGFLYDADTIFAQVLNEMEKMSNSLSNGNKLLLIEMIDPVIDLAMESSWELFVLTNNTCHIDKMFNYVERGKSSELLSAVNSEHAFRTSDIPDATFRYGHQLKDEINGLVQLLEHEKTKEDTDDKNIDFFEAGLLVLLNRHDSLIMSIERDYPKYYSVKYSREVMDPMQVKQNLMIDEALVEYHLADSVLYTITMTNGEFDVKRLMVDSSFFNSLNYIISIKDVDLGRQNFKKFREFMHHSHNLYKTLIEPADKLLGNKRLIIIPDGLLSYLPFDLLIEHDFKIDSISYRGLPYLIKNHPVSYSYSATLKYNTYFRPDRKKPKHNILAFAPLYPFNPGYPDTVDSHQLENLPFAKEEALEIVNNQGGMAYCDESATKNNFLQHAGSSNILHLAMHTMINDSLPMQSKLVFYDDKNDTVSNYMFTHEIYNIDLNASMVTLSACNTGSGKFSKGEGIMSLARGFVYAGVPSIVMTLWEVQDATGSIIMNNYYRFLSEGMTKDVALQQAKLSMLKVANMAEAHPYFWSTYIVSGDTSTINTSNKNNNHHYAYYWIIGISLILAVGLVSYSGLGKVQGKVHKKCN